MSVLTPVPATGESDPTARSRTAAEAEWVRPTWEEVVTNHSAKVYRLAYRLTGNKYDAEDLTQEVFVRVFRSLENFKPGTLDGWLHRITTNLFLDQARRKSRIRFDALADDAESRIPGREPGPEQSFELNNLDIDVQAALEELPPDFRAAVVLCDLEGLSYDEVAAALDIKLGTVRSRIHRGRTMPRKARAPALPARRRRPSSLSSRGQHAPHRRPALIRSMGLLQRLREALGAGSPAGPAGAGSALCGSGPPTIVSTWSRVPSAAAGNSASARYPNGSAVPQCPRPATTSTARLLARTEQLAARTARFTAARPTTDRPPTDHTALPGTPAAAAERAACYGSLPPALAAGGAVAALASMAGTAYLMGGDAGSRRRNRGRCPLAVGDRRADRPDPARRGRSGNPGSRREAGTRSASSGRRRAGTFLYSGRSPHAGQLPPSGRRGWARPELQELGFHLVWARAGALSGDEVLELHLTDGSALRHGPRTARADTGPGRAIAPGGVPERRQTLRRSTS